MGRRTPKLLEHLDSRGLPPEVLMCDFFLSLGCRALPPLSVLRVWDVLFWEGGDTLQYVALAMLRLAEVTLVILSDSTGERPLFTPARHVVPVETCAVYPRYLTKPLSNRIGKTFPFSSVRSEVQCAELLYHELLSIAGTYVA